MKVTSRLLFFMLAQATLSLAQGARLASCIGFADFEVAGAFQLELWWENVQAVSMPTICGAFQDQVSLNGCSSSFVNCNSDSFIDGTGSRIVAGIRADQSDSFDAAQICVQRAFALALEAPIAPGSGGVPNRCTLIVSGDTNQKRTLPASSAKRQVPPTPIDAAVAIASGQTLLFDSGAIMEVIAVLTHGGVLPDTNTVGNSFADLGQALATQGDTVAFGLATNGLEVGDPLKFALEAYMDTGISGGIGPADAGSLATITAASLASMRVFRKNQITVLLRTLGAGGLMAFTLYVI